MIEVMHAPGTQNATPQMFADLVLDLLEYLRVIAPGTYAWAIPSEKSPPDWRAPAEARLAVDGLLSLIRQTQVQGEDVYFKRLLKFFNALPLSTENKKSLEWLACRFDTWELPSEAQVETTLLNDHRGVPVKSLDATCRFVAAMHLYGRLVHRKLGKRKHLGSLAAAFGPKYVFERCGQYAEYVGRDLVALAVLWMGHTRGGHLPCPGKGTVFISFPDSVLDDLSNFLQSIAAPLNEATELRWSASF